MSEDKTEILDTVYPILLEELVGKGEWESFLGKIQAGKFDDTDAMNKYLNRVAVKKYGRLLAEERLDSHDEKILAKIEQILGVEKDFGKEKGDHAQTKRQLKQMQSHVKFLETEIILELAKAVGYTAEPVYVTDKRQTLQHNYIRELIEYIKANGTAGAGAAGATAQLGESNKLLLENAKENKELSDKVTVLAGENTALAEENKALVSLKSEHDELKAKYEKLLEAHEDLGLKFQTYYNIVEAFKADIKPELEKANKENQTEE